jgi:hypothetical protein
MCNCCTHKCFITLQAVTSATQIQLPDNSRIRNGRVTSIALRRSGSATLKTITGATVAADSVIATANMFLVTLGGEQICAPIPLSFLQRDYNAPEPLKVNWQQIDLTQSTITLTPANATDVVEIIFGLDCDFCEVKI